MSKARDGEQVKNLFSLFCFDKLLAEFIVAQGPSSKGELRKLALQTGIDTIVGLHYENAEAESYKVKVATES